MDIIKASGEREVFRREKFCRSLAASGASDELVQKICSRIEDEVVPETSTKDLSSKASKYLAEANMHSAARYSLRRGIMELGPAGFFFEHYIEALLQSYGYHTKRNQIMQGECVMHEVDVTAADDTTHYMLEIKYHNSQGIKTHIDVVMYAYARLLDIAPEESRREANQPQPTKKNHAMWLITNTKFTATATTYGMCKGIKLTGWSHPRGESLEELIVAKRLYPVTVLPAVNEYAREQFAKHNLMFAKDLLKYSAPDLASRFDIHAHVAEDIRRQAEEIDK